MKDHLGITMKKPVSFWLKDIKVDFKDLFKALGKAILGVKTGIAPLTITGLVDSISVFKFEKDSKQLVWILIYRSIARAMFMLIEENQILLREATKGFQSLANEATLSEGNLFEIAEKLEYVVDARNLAIDEGFFSHPKEFDVIKDLKKVFAQWLEQFGLNTSQSVALSDRLPSYFVYSLHYEWRERREDYDLIVKEIPTPFTNAAKVEQEWEYYYSHLQKRIDEPLFGEAFGLRQIYIPLRAFQDKRNFFSVVDSYSDSTKGDISTNYSPNLSDVIDLENELEKWVNDSEKKDAIRVISGGPGYGKSSVAKMFAAKQSLNPTRKVLYIPLHLFDPTTDLAQALERFLTQEGFFSSCDFLDPKKGEKRLLLIFDGLDELTMQGRVGNEIAQQFIKEVQRKVDIFNIHEQKLKIVICGRDIAVQAGAENLDRKALILHLAPYYLNPSTGIRLKDQRDTWWKCYGKIIGKNFIALPEDLKTSNFEEITSLPLLNYLVALSYVRGNMDLGKQNNLNAIYQYLLKSVYKRENLWADKQHVSLGNISENEFIRIFEEIALAAWQSGDARKVTVKEIERYCNHSGLNTLLEKFKEKAKDGVPSLLVAFYFKKSGIQTETLDDTFEFTHKSFSEYLTVRRIIRGVKVICEKTKARQESYEEGWDQVQSLTYWVELCGRNSIDPDLLNFIRREVELVFQINSNLIKEWQSVLSNLFSKVLKQGMPMEKLADNRPVFSKEVIWSKNASETLFAVLHSCALLTKQKIEEEYLDKDLFPRWVNNNISKKLISNLLLPNTKWQGIDLEEADLEGTDLREANLEGANLKGANLKGVNLKGASLQRTDFNGANFDGAYLQDAKLEHSNLKNVFFQKAFLKNVDLTGANLEGANLQWSYMEGTNLERTHLQDANLEYANLERARLQGANLRGANLQRASLKGAFLERAYLQDANLEKANLEGAVLAGTFLNQTNLKDANLKDANLKDAYLTGVILQGAIWVDGRHIIDGKYPELVFAE